MDDNDHQPLPYAAPPRPKVDEPPDDFFVLFGWAMLLVGLFVIMSVLLVILL